MSDVSFYLVLNSEADFKSKQQNSNIVKIAMKQVDDLETLSEFLKKTYSVTNVTFTTANKVRYNHDGDGSSLELLQSSTASFQYTIRDFDIVLFEVPKEEGKFVAYYEQFVLYNNLQDYT